MRHFKSNIGEILKKKGITQKELAKLIGVTEASVSRYVSGDRIPKGTTCIQIAKILDCEFDDLYTLKKEKDQVSEKMPEYEPLKALRGKYPSLLGLSESDEYKMAQIVINALEKRIPKKPIKYKTPENIPVYKCPCCYNIDVDEQEYCDQCGQKLDWMF